MLWRILSDDYTSFDDDDDDDDENDVNDENGYAYGVSWIFSFSSSFYPRMMKILSID